MQADELRSKIDGWIKRWERDEERTWLITVHKSYTTKTPLRDWWGKSLNRAGLTNCCPRACYTQTWCTWRFFSQQWTLGEFLNRHARFSDSIKIRILIFIFLLDNIVRLKFDENTQKFLFDSIVNFHYLLK